MPAIRPFRTVLCLLGTSMLLLTGCAADDGPQPPDGGPGGGADAAQPPPAEVAEDLRPYHEQELSWRSCGPAGFQCATLNVPLDYDNIDPADDLQLSVSRIRAAGAGERIGSLLVNPGGPGASAVEYLQGFAGRGFPEPVRDRYDMVALDPRGTVGSEPVECLTDAEMDAFTQVDRTPDDEAEAEELREALAGFGSGCQERSGRLLEHISTADSAHDLDLLRAVLGDERLHYYGASYGTKLGAVYADLYPARAGRLVLDAAVDPSQSSLDRDREQAGGFETAFQSFLADCATRDDCPVTGADDVSELFAQLDEEPLPTGESRPLTESLATVGTAGALYSPALWPELRSALAAALEEDNGGPMLALADSYHDRGPGGTYGTLMFAFPAISCLDDEPAVRDVDQVHEELDSFLAASPTFGHDFAWATLTCADWPVEPKGSAAPVTAEGASDILVVGTTRDPATPYAWSEALAGQLRSGVLLTYDGDGHGAYGQSACVDDAVNSYLLEGTAPEEGTVC